MKKLMTMIFVITMPILLLGCSSDNQAIDIIVSSYEQLEEIETVQDSHYKDGTMLGDAYYVTGTKDEFIQVVHHYKGEYISISIGFDEQTSEEMVAINLLRIDYCDYEKDLFITSSGSFEDVPVVFDHIGYQALFDQIENLSIQELRNVLKTINLL